MDNNTTPTYNDVEARQLDGRDPLPPRLERYYRLKRERTIAELRELDRILGRKQTIPERVR